MHIRHLFPTIGSQTTVDGDRAFFLRGGTGDFVSFFTTPQTRYAGWFVAGDAESKDSVFYKIIESIVLLDIHNDPEPVTGLTVLPGGTVWEYEDGRKMTWKTLSTLPGLSLNLSHSGRVRVVLDPRSMYEFPGLGRQLDVTGSAGAYAIRYQDPSLPQPLYVHLRCKENLDLAQTWQEQAYPRDAARHSKPDSLFVYNLGEVTTNQLSFGFGWTAEEAERAAVAASKQRLQVPNQGETQSLETLMSQTAVARASVHQALRWLETEKGLYAGLPWFHQVWSRDELIAALGLTKDEQWEIISRYLGLELQNGELPTFVGSGTTCADGVGWLLLVIQEYGLENLDADTQTRLLHFCQGAYTQLKASRQAGHGFITSTHNATWMDTIGRTGFRLEIQCMFGLLLETLHELTEDPIYQQERIRLIGNIRSHFFKKGYLADGLGDPRKRPNVFLAYLLQPELLSETSWRSCFDLILQALALPWGGLASLDPADPEYQPTTTGEDNRSYHNGDSWFFVNNLAALALQRFDPRAYGPQVICLLQSSTNEILWSHMVGMPGEISSAKALESFGCGIQAFSGGTYLALLNELDGYGPQERDATTFFWDSSADSAASSRLP